MNMKQIGGFFDGLARRIEAEAGIYLILACWIFFAVTGIRAGHTTFWLDELFTIHLCALPRFIDVWNALRAGIDLNPPFQYVAVRSAQAIFGSGPLAIRLPVLAGYLVMSVSIYLFLRRRLPLPMAFAGMMLPWLAGTYRFALDARPYGILLGCSGVALLCWARAAGTERPRRAALTGLWVSITLALLTHYYAVLLALPFLLGEWRRFTERRKPDWPMWTTLALSALPVAIYPLVFQVEKGQTSRLWPFHVTWLTGPDAYRYLLEPLVWPLLVGAALSLASGKSPAGECGRGKGMTGAELAALIGFALIPAAAAGLAAATTGSFEPRYGAPGVLGVACLLPWMGTRYGPGKAARNGAVFATVFLVFFTAGFLWKLWEATQRPAVVHAAKLPNGSSPAAPEILGYPLIGRVPPGNLPLVLANAAAFLEVGYYAGDDLARRLYYVTDPNLALRRTGSSGIDLILSKMQRLPSVKGHIEAAGPFLAEHPRFLIYYCGQFTEWLVGELQERGWKLRLLDREGPAKLAEVTAPLTDGH